MPNDNRVVVEIFPDPRYEVDLRAILSVEFPWEYCSGSFSDGGLVLDMAIEV